MNKAYLRGQVLIFENSGTIVRRRVLFQETGLPGKSTEKEIVKKMEKFLKCFLFKCR